MRTFNASRGALPLFVPLLLLGCSTTATHLGKDHSVTAHAAVPSEGSRLAGECRHRSFEESRGLLDQAWDLAERSEVDSVMQVLSSCMSGSGCLNEATQKPLRSEALRLQGLIHVTRGEFAYAVSTLRGAVQSEPSGWAAPATWCMFELAAFHLGAWEEIADAGKKVLKVRNLPPRFENLLRHSTARALYEIGDTQAAQKIFEYLEFADAWSVVGPFNNIAGSGFDRVFGPELNAQQTSVYRDDWDIERHWRVDPTLETPWVDLNSLYAVGGSGVFYGFTHLMSPAAASAILHVGSGGGIKIWLNGELVLSIEKPRALYDDLYSIPVDLRAGTNWILLKSAKESRDFAGFTLRLTDSQYAPLRGLTWEARIPDPDVPLEVSEAQGGGASEPTWWIYEELLRRFEKVPTVETLVLLGQQADHGDFEEEFLQFVGQLPPELTRCSLVLHAIANAELVTKDFNAFRTTCTALRQEDSRSFLGLRMEVDRLNAEGQHERAASLLQGHLANYPSAQFVEVMRLEHLMEHGPFTEIPSSVESLQEQDINEPKTVFFISMFLDAMERNGERIDYLEKHLRRNASSRLLLGALLGAYQDKGRHDAIIDLLRSYKRLRPMDEALLCRLALACVEREEFVQAEEQARAVLDHAPDSEMAMGILARALQGQGKVSESTKLYRRAMQRNPNDWVTREGLLSMGIEFPETTRFIREPLEKLIAKDRENPAFPEAHSYWLLVDCQRVILSDLASKARYRLVGRVNDVSGVEQNTQAILMLPENTFHYDVEKVVTVKPDGRQLTGEVAEVSVSFAELAPGDYFELVYTAYISCMTAIGREVWQTHLLIQEQPTALSRFQLIHPRHLEIAMRTPPGVEKSAKPLSGTYARTIWRARDLPAMDFEPGATLAFLKDYMLDISSVASWNQVGRWYERQAYRPRGSIAALQSKAEEVVRGLERPEDKVLALARFVAGRIAYSNHDFIIEAIRPTDPVTVLRRGIGDCKDQCFLLLALAGTVGIEGNLALVDMDFGRESDFLPSMRFNHAVVRLTTGDREWWVDPTMAWHDPSTPPRVLQGTTVLLLDGESSRMVEVPTQEATKDRSFILTKLHLADRGRSDQRTRVSEWGEIASESRFALAETAPGRERDLIQFWYGPEIGSFEVTHVSFPNVATLQESLQFEYVAERSLPLNQFGSGIAVVVPFQMMIGSLSGVSLRERTTALDVSFMRGEFTERVEIELAAPWILLELPSPVEVVLEEAEYSFATWIQEDGIIVVQRRFVLRAFEIAPDRCPAFRDFMDRVSQADRSVILLGKS